MKDRTFENPTVRELIEFLKTCDQDAIVCKSSLEVIDDELEVIHQTVQRVYEREGKYEDENDEIREGKTLSI